MVKVEASPAKAGPSKQPKKRERKRSSSKSIESVSPQPPSKLSRIDDEGPDVAGGAGVDPMEALETNGDEDKPDVKGEIDPMENLENQAEDVEATSAPVRADEFEQEAERVVEAAKGLDGGAGEEGQVKLVHQVRHQVRTVFYTVRPPERQVLTVGIGRRPT
jgi:ATP-dependent RNA helicase DOB1